MGDQISHARTSCAAALRVPLTPLPFSLCHAPHNRCMLSFPCADAGSFDTQGGVYRLPHHRAGIRHIEGVPKPSGFPDPIFRHGCDACAGCATPSDQPAAPQGWHSKPLHGPAPTQVTRYQSTTFSLTYNEYQRINEEGRHGTALQLRRQRQLVAVGAQS